MVGRKHRVRRLLFFFLGVLALVLTTQAASVAAEKIEPLFLYKLSDFEGIVPFSGVKMFSDVVFNEMYVLDGGTIRIYNQAGMEVYRFNDDGSLGNLYGCVVDKDGNIIALAYDQSQYFLIRCNYRGDLAARLELKNIPSDVQAGFRPTFLAYREGHLYLADSGSMTVLVTDEQGVFEQSIDLLDATGLPKTRRGSTDMMGFSVNREGSIFFTIPTEFCAYRRSPNGEVTSYCQRGSAAGKFNVAAGIVSDDSGYIYVSDKLKSSVLIFDNNFKFLRQLGYRGYGPYGMIIPEEMAVLGNKLYVSQGAEQGVSVFSITH